MRRFDYYTEKESRERSAQVMDLCMAKHAERNFLELEDRAPSMAVVKDAVVSPVG